MIQIFGQNHLLTAGWKYGPQIQRCRPHANGSHELGWPKHFSIFAFAQAPARASQAESDAHAPSKTRSHLLVSDQQERVGWFSEFLSRCYLSQMDSCSRQLKFPCFVGDNIVVKNQIMLSNTI